MKRRMICFVIAMLLLSAAGTVLAESSSSSVNNVPPNSLQLMYAKLQLEMAEIVRVQAMEQMAHVESIQNEQRELFAHLNTARQCQSIAADTGEASEMPADMAEYMNSNQLVYDSTGSDLLMTSKEWNTVIASLENHLNVLSAKVQQAMLDMQTIMGQYNLYLQGANMQNTNSSQTLTSLARGQSMYGDSEAGLAVTYLLVGLVLGCALTLAAQKLRKERGKA